MYGASKTAEVFSPTKGKVCPVGDLPMENIGMSLCHGMVCGGGNTAATKNCFKFDQTSNSFSSLPVSLVERRSDHPCWELPSGEVRLMGGNASPEEV